ncbi:MAG: hypothetical protein ACW990_02525 [Promethearchaeota archaeon]
MNHNCKQRTLITDIPLNNYELLGDIMNKLNQILNSRREIMYSDIINLIIREGKLGKSYNELIRWCNYKIRLGETFVEI